MELYLSKTEKISFKTIREGSKMLGLPDNKLGLFLMNKLYDSSCGKKILVVALFGIYTHDKSPIWPELKDETVQEYMSKIYEKEEKSNEFHNWGVKDDSDRT